MLSEMTSTCSVCHIDFEHSLASARFCSESCRQRHYYLLKKEKKAQLKPEKPKVYRGRSDKEIEKQAIRLVDLYG